MMREYWLNSDDGVDRISSHKPLGTAGLGKWTQAFDAHDVRATIKDLEEQIKKLRNAVALREKIKLLELNNSILVEQRNLEISMRLATSEDIANLINDYDGKLKTEKAFIVRGLDAGVE